MNAIFCVVIALGGQGLAEGGRKPEVIPVNLECKVLLDGKFKEDWRVKQIVDFHAPHFVETKTRDGKNKVVFNLGIMVSRDGEAQILIADQTKSVDVLGSQAKVAQPLASTSFNLKKFSEPITLGAYGGYGGLEPEIKLSCRREKKSP